MTDDAPVPPANPDQIYTPSAGELQLTVRAVVSGCVLGSAIVAMNLYLGLKIGWTVGGSLMAAILGFAFFTAISPRQRYSVLECNITQTAGSGAGTMASAAGFVAPIPALKMLGYEIPLWGMFLWAASIAYLGVMFAVPLRRQYVVVEKLKFPSGTATANTIVAMFATAGEAVAKAKVLLWFGVGAFAYIVGAYFVPQLEHPPIGAWVQSWFGVTLLATWAMWGFSLYLGPMLFGAGFLIGPRVGVSLAAGAVIGWGALGYLAQQQGWAPAANPMQIFDPDARQWAARGWILWPGVAIMVGDAMMSLGLSWRTFVNAFKRTGAPQDGSLAPVIDPESIPNSWWVTGLALGSAASVLVAWQVFDIPIYLSLIAIALSAILANVAVRSTGETDINPVGGMGKVTQGAFGLLSSSMPTNLMAAGITGAGASQAGDMMQDLKTGYLLGASPRKQFTAQMWGIAAGAIAAVPIYLVYDHAYEIGGATSKLGAPAAIAWKAVAEVMSKGIDALPPHAGLAMLAGLTFGAAIPVVRRVAPKLAPYTPSGMAFGIAFIVQPYYSIVMFLGSLGLIAWERISPEGCKRLVYAVSCGLIAGEGLAGLVNAVMTILDVPTLTG